MKLPGKIYFHISQARNDGWLIREAIYSEAGDLDTLLSEIDDYTVAVILLEDGIESDVSEDVALAWVRLNDERREIDVDDSGDAEVFSFIRDHASEALAQIEGRIATERMNNQRHREHQFSRAS